MNINMAVGSTRLTLFARDGGSMFCVVERIEKMLPLSPWVL